MNRTVLFTLAVALALPAAAEVTLPSILSDGVVLQRGEPLKIWGKGTPGEKVNVSLDKRKGSTEVGADSTWSVTLNAMKAGGPYKLKVNDITIDDVLIGDLYLCSGQSNMELPVSRTLDLFRDDVAAYRNDRIREFKTPKEYAFHGGRDDVSRAEWKKAVPGESERFGALVYFMARKLYEENGNVPVGIVNSSWGGSRIEAWLSEEALEEYPVRLNRLRIAEDDRYRNGLNGAERRAQDLWYANTTKYDPGYKDGVSWTSPAYDDSSWQTVPLLGREWGSRDGKPLNGSHWLRKRVDIPADKAGEEAEIRLGCIVDADSVWVNGRFVGNITYQYPPRIYKIPAGTLKADGNVVTVRVVSNGGTPHFVEEKPHKIIFKDGSEVSLEGVWRHHIGAQMPPTPGVTDFFQTPSVLYNGLISPVLNFPYRGVVWYQGESDIDNRGEYDRLMKSLIADWRAKRGDALLPFYIVELADFLHPNDKGGRQAWQEMRDAQRKAAEETAEAWWIQNGDVGEWNDIHPRDKKTPGDRVAQKILENPHK